MGPFTFGTIYYVDSDNGSDNYSGTAKTEALTRVTYEDRPFAFVTPEAWDAEGNFRGALYIRPLSIWAVEEALR